MINLTPTCNKFDLPGGDGLTISCRQWGEEKDAGLAALLVHGLGAHSGWFEAFAERLTKQGFVVYSYDQVGFGDRTDQPFKSNRQWSDDLTTVHAHLARTSRLPIVLMGNSMGALVALVGLRSLSPAPKGLAMFSPGFDGHPKTFSLPYKLSAIAKSILAPEDEVRLPYSENEITSSQSVRDALSQDERATFTIKARMGLELLKFTQLAKRQQIISVPLFMATAGHELIVDNRINNRFYQSVKAPSKTHLHLQDSWHDLMFEETLPQLVEAVTDWAFSGTLRRE